MSSLSQIIYLSQFTHEFRNQIHVFLLESKDQLLLITDHAKIQKKWKFYAYKIKRERKVTQAHYMRQFTDELKKTFFLSQLTFYFHQRRFHTLIMAAILASHRLLVIRIHLYFYHNEL